MVGQHAQSFSQYFSPNQMLELLRDLVCFESPSRDKEALDALAAILAERLHQRGAAVEIVENERGGNHVLGRIPGAVERRPALVLGHFDTVWPRGTLTRMPFRIGDDGFAYGPGIFDMKASLVLLLAVLETLQNQDVSLPRPVWVCLNSDEEIGSPTSREGIEQLAKACAYVLVLEPPLADGGVKTSRKGVGRFRLEVEGQAAHAGTAPENGRSAIVELARQIVRIQELQDRRAGTTLNVGLIDGGTSVNVVPAQAWAEIDVRIATQSEAGRIKVALESLEPIDPDTRLAVTGGFNRPPMERTAGNAALFERARRIAGGLGIELTEGPSGGGSDGNFTSALGIPTLDGLGARGGGAHAVDERILIASLPERAALLVSLLMELHVE
jgi:glutamate carboxypeptidase